MHLEDVDELTRMLPGNKINDGTIVASVVYRDSDEDGKQLDRIEWTVIVLNPQPPYYTVMTLAPATPDTAPTAGWHIFYEQDHPNIVPAVRDYEQNGGDY